MHSIDDIRRMVMQWPELPLAVVAGNERRPGLSTEEIMDGLIISVTRLLWNGASEMVARSYLCMSIYVNYGFVSGNHLQAIADAKKLPSFLLADKALGMINKLPPEQFSTEHSREMHLWLLTGPGMSEVGVRQLIVTHFIQLREELLKHGSSGTQGTIHLIEYSNLWIRTLEKSLLENNRSNLVCWR